VHQASFRERNRSLSTFTPAATAELPGPDWLRQRRSDAAEAFSSAPLPTEKDEVWRYSRIDELDLERFHPAGSKAAPVAADSGPSTSDRIHALVSQLGARAGLVVTVDGVVATVATTVGEDRLALGRAADHDELEAILGSVATEPRDFLLLNDAFLVDPVLVDVRPGAVIEEPIVVVHVLTGGEGTATFPRTIVRSGSGSKADVVELTVEADVGLLVDRSPNGVIAPKIPVERLIVPVTELRVEDEAALSYVNIQSLGRATWQLAHHASTIGERATLSSFAAALGGGYARLRTDSQLRGTGGTSRLRAAYVGRGDQMLDFRTLQDHAAPKTVSDLLFMGAVAERSHSVYSGLIRVRRGAVRANAMQTNHNLVLDEGAHADSVPNLDIEENDVQCSHGSTVGPVDEDQRYYLESRGVEPDRAEQLIVAGFFESIADRVPVDAARTLVGEALAERIGAVYG
jgi:Fe-S cluster assembly protein SufD